MQEGKWILPECRRDQHFVLAVLSFPLIKRIQSGACAQVLLAQLIFAVLIVFPLEAASALLVELFPADERLTGYAVAFNSGIDVVGGTTPMIATWLIETTSVVSAPAFYLSVLAIIAAALLLMMKGRSRDKLL